MSLGESEKLPFLEDFSEIEVEQSRSYSVKEKKVKNLIKRDIEQTIHPTSEVDLEQPLLPIPELSRGSLHGADEHFPPKPFSSLALTDLGEERPKRPRNDSLIPNEQMQQPLDISFGGYQFDQDIRDFVNYRMHLQFRRVYSD